MVPCVVVLIVSLFVGANYINTFNGKKECAVVYGAAVWQGDRPSHALTDRIMAGVDLYNNAQVSCLVLSGSQVPGRMHEVEMMKKIAMGKGIPESAIREDHNGINTLATLRNLPKGVDGFVMVSNDFHLARIRMLSKKVGLEGVALHAAPYRHTRYIKEPMFFFREVAAVIYYSSIL
ncbi:MAG: YdcF family protein [Magnetococcales bacterium]|nr:YdcF family protein [Magnetococcales bacterium]